MPYRNPFTVVTGVTVILIIYNTDKSSFSIGLHHGNARNGTCFNTT